MRKMSKYLDRHEEITKKIYESLKDFDGLESSVIAEALIICLSSVVFSGSEKEDYAVNSLWSVGVLTRCLQDVTNFSLKEEACP